MFRETDSTNQKYTDFYNGLDRLNSSIGYYADNVVSCCRTCNIAKHTMSEEEYKNWIKKSYNKLFGE